MNDEIDVEFGFTPAVSATGDDQGSPGRAGRSSAPARSSRPAGKRSWRRRAAGGMVLVAGLAAMGGLYGLFASSSGADSSTADSANIATGQQLFDVSCITCHGANLQGVTDRGPSLLGVGASATYFQLSTGRMPATAQGAEEYRKTSQFTEAQTDDIAAFVQSIGGGPTVPTGSLRTDSSQVAAGGELFRLNCASCHGLSMRGAPLSAGKTAPSLGAATDKQIYTAMQSGPENMPVFSDNELTPDQKKSIVTYIQTMKASKDPGGNGLDRIGPVSEALVIWILGIGAMVATILWIGAKS
ncbi:MAG TPA: cytochrome c [Jatrophihabitantaceae bacterium]|nr:cytochrome c [Jatrophihabitantaceae bacterium]